MPDAIDLATSIFSLVRALLTDWEEADVRYYFRLAYLDADMSLQVETDSGIAARILARGVADMLVERMRYLRVREERRLLQEGGHRYLTD